MGRCNIAYTGESSSNPGAVTEHVAHPTRCPALHRFALVGAQALQQVRCDCEPYRLGQLADRQCELAHAEQNEKRGDRQRLRRAHVGRHRRTRRTQANADNGAAGRAPIFGALKARRSELARVRFREVIRGRVACQRAFRCHTSDDQAAARNFGRISRSYSRKTAS